MRSAALVALGSWLALAGCGPTLATLQPAHVAPKGHVQAAAGFEIGVPTGTLSRVVDAGQVLSDKVRSCHDASCRLTPDEQGRLFDAGVTLASSPLSYSQHLALSYAFADGAEAGLRWAAGNWRLQGRFQTLRRQDGPFDMVIGLGVARGATAIPFGDTLPVLTIDDFTRWTVDVPITIGTSRSWFHVWAGVKLAYTRFETTMHLELSADDIEVAHFNGHGFYGLAQGGVAFGYRYVFLALELTMGQLFGSSNAAIIDTAAAPAGSRSTDLGGFVIYPAVALIGEI